MSVFQSLVLGKTFDSYDDVLAVIQQVSDQDNIYLRREKTQTIESFNNRKDCKTKLDLKWQFYLVQYICPHAAKYKPRPTTGERPDQNIMACGCLAEINFQFRHQINKFEITKSVLEHQGHPISAEHKKTYTRKKNMSAEALEFAKNAISVGAQPTRLRVLLSKKFGTHLISKDIINLKQSLTGNDESEWQDTVDVLVKFAEEISTEEGGSTNCDASKGCESTEETSKEAGASNKHDAAKEDDTPVTKEGRRANVVQVVHGEDGEVEGIYFQTDTVKKVIRFSNGKTFEMSTTQIEGYLPLKTEKVHLFR